MMFDRESKKVETLEEVVAEMRQFVSAHSHMRGVDPEIVYTCSSVHGLGVIRISTIKRAIEIMESKERDFELELIVDTAVELCEAIIESLKGAMMVDGRETRRCHVAKVLEQASDVEGLAETFKWSAKAAFDEQRGS